jgi:hypothetical protein
VQFIISQDIVATHSGFGVKYNNCCLVYLVLDSMLNYFLKSVNIWLRYGQKYRGPFFDSQCSGALWTFMCWHNCLVSSAQWLLVIMAFQKLFITCYLITQ